jgi:hypothetical protein
MAVANRYTNIQPSRYNPRSLQELMIAPQYMRQQHTAIEDGLSGVNTELAQVDPLDIHSEQARMEQSKMYDNITQQSDRLNKEGFSPVAKSQFLKLNKQYQQSISPTGALGKINAAKTALSENKAKYLESAQKEGFPLDVALQNWKDQEAQYEQEFNTTGKISNIGELYAPKYKDAIAEGKTLFKDAGITSTDIGSSGGKIHQDSDGSYIVNTSSRDVNSNNTKQLEAAVEWINNQVLNQGSDINRSIVHERKDPQNVIKELAGLSDVYKKDQTVEDRQTSFSSWNPAKGNDITNNGMGLAVANQQFAPAKLSNVPLQDAKEKIIELTQLKESEGLDKKQTQELYELEKYTNKVNEVLQHNPEYVKLNSVVIEKEQELQDKINGEYNYNNDIQVAQIRSAYKDLPREQMETAITDYVNRDITNSSSFLNSMKGELDDLVSPAAKTIQQQLTAYQVIPTTTKQASLVKVMDQNVDQLFRGNPQNIQSMVNIQELQVDGEAITDLTPDDLDGITRLINNTDLGAVKVMNVIPNDFEDKPGYVLRIDTKKDNKYNLDGLGRGDIGDGRPLTLRVNFDDTNNEVGVNNVNGLVKQFVASTGPAGSELVKNMDESQTIKRYYNKTWGELADSGILDQDIKAAEMFDAKLKNIGITKDNTEEEIIKGMQTIYAEKVQ